MNLTEIVDGAKAEVSSALEKINDPSFGAYVGALAVVSKKRRKKIDHNASFTEIESEIEDPETFEGIAEPDVEAIKIYRAKRKEAQSHLVAAINSTGSLFPSLKWYLKSIKEDVGDYTHQQVKEVIEYVGNLLENLPEGYHPATVLPTVDVEGKCERSIDGVAELPYADTTIDEVELEFLSVGGRVENTSNLTLGDGNSCYVIGIRFLPLSEKFGLERDLTEYKGKNVRAYTSDNTIVGVALLAFEPFQEPPEFI